MKRSSLTFRSSPASCECLLPDHKAVDLTREDSVFLRGRPLYSHVTFQRHFSVNVKPVSQPEVRACLAVFTERYLWTVNKLGMKTLWFLNITISALHHETNDGIFKYIPYS